LSHQIFSGYLPSFTYCKTELASLVVSCRELRQNICRSR